MGTRNFIGVISDGKYKIAQYSQWDGYPSGQGATVLKFLSKANIGVFHEKLNNCRYIDKSELRQMYINAGDDPDNTSGWISSDVADRFSELYPSLSRDTGADILNIVYESTSEVPLWNNEDFLNDELFCEFGYVIDVDRETLHCYCGGKRLFAEYILLDLPTVEEMQQDLDEWYRKEHSITDEEEC